jgi:hypothetical protein
MKGVMIAMLDQVMILLCVSKLAGCVESLLCCWSYLCQVGVSIHKNEAVKEAG